MLAAGRAGIAKHSIAALGARAQVVSHASVVDPGQPAAHRSLTATARPCWALPIPLVVRWWAVVSPETDHAICNSVTHAAQAVTRQPYTGN